MVGVAECTHENVMADHCRDIVWTVCLQCGLEGWPVLRERGSPPRPGTMKTEPGTGRVVQPLCRNICKAEPVWEDGEMTGTIYKRCSLRDGHGSPCRYIEGIGDYYSESAPDFV